MSYSMSVCVSVCVCPTAPSLTRAAVSISRKAHTRADRVFIYSMDSETRVDITMQVRKGLSAKQPVQDGRLPTEVPWEQSGTSPADRKRRVEKDVQDKQQLEPLRRGQKAHLLLLGHSSYISHDSTNRRVKFTDMSHDSQAFPVPPIPRPSPALPAGMNLFTCKCHTAAAAAPPPATGAALTRTSHRASSSGTS